MSLPGGKKTRRLFGLCSTWTEPSRMINLEVVEIERKTFKIQRIRAGRKMWTREGME